MLNSLKTKWKIESNFQFLIIMLVFSITGSLTLYIVDPLLLFLNISDDNFSNFQYWFLRIFIVFPTYQVLLIIIGSIFGQFSFFWNFEKKMLSRFNIIKTKDKL
tara:strand:+ start:411 stop:722 length:312 start_codon:yes stop_codon:yes gene_type:complete